MSKEMDEIERYAGHPELYNLALRCHAAEERVRQLQKDYGDLKKKTFDPLEFVRITDTWDPSETYQVLAVSSYSFSFVYKRWVEDRAVVDLLVEDAVDRFREELYGVLERSGIRGAKGGTRAEKEKAHEEAYQAEERLRDLFDREGG